MPASHTPIDSRSALISSGVLITLARLAGSCTTFSIRSSLDSRCSSRRSVWAGTRMQQTCPRKGEDRAVSAVPGALRLQWSRLPAGPGPRSPRSYRRAAFSQIAGQRPLAEESRRGKQCAPPCAERPRLRPQARWPHPQPAVLEETLSNQNALIDTRLATKPQHYRRPLPRGSKSDPPGLNSAR
jgi:hypothetical protein